MFFYTIFLEIHFTFGSVGIHYQSSVLISVCVSCSSGMHIPILFIRRICQWKEWKVNFITLYCLFANTCIKCADVETINQLANISLQIIIFVPSSLVWKIIKHKACLNCHSLKITLSIDNLYNKWGDHQNPVL